jgi:hypothetical protein
MRGALRMATHLFLVLAAAGAAACGGDSGGSTGPSDPPPPPGGGTGSAVEGSYGLQQVRTLGNLGGGGSGLPVTFIDGSGDHLTFVGGTLILTSGGSFDLKIQVTFNGSQSELTDYGTYSVSGGGVIDFDSQKATPRLSTASVNGSMITAKGQVGGIPFEWDVQR